VRYIKLAISSACERMLIRRIVSYRIAPLCINQRTKFEIPSFTDTKDMIGRQIKKRVA